MNPLHLGAAAASIATILTVGHAPPVAADTAVPAGCTRTAVNGWTPNCWVGTNYSTSSNMVLAAQTIARYFPASRPWGLYHEEYMNTFTRDGKYGGSTDSAITTWQRDRNDDNGFCSTGSLGSCIGEDGIVGGQTWGAMQDDGLSNYLPSSGGGYMFFTGTADTAVFALDISGAGVGGWQVLKPGGGVWLPMTVDAGPPY